MTREEAIKVLCTEKKGIEREMELTIREWEEHDKLLLPAIDIAIEALQAKTDGDTISRQDAIDAMWKALYAYEDLTEKQFMEHEELELGDWFQHRIFVQRMHEECMKAVNSLPSAEPKTGKWMPDNNSLYETRFICSECKESEVVPTTGFTKYKPIWDYCPNCGARMTPYKGGEEEAEEVTT